MENISGKNQQVGTHGYVLLNGTPIFECTSFEGKVTVNRDDVQNGLDIYSVITGLKGEGTLSINMFFTRGFNTMLEAYKRGEDPRFTIVSGLKSPGSYKKQSENVIYRNVWFNELTLQKWQKGEKVTKDIPFGFTPSSAQYEDVIDND